jgi:hypothetical protein
MTIYAGIIYSKYAGGRDIYARNAGIPNMVTIINGGFINAKDADIRHR